MTEYERMLAGELYDAGKIDPAHKPYRNRALAQQINQTNLLETEKISELEKQLFARTGERLYIYPPLHVDYGFNTTIGENFYANTDCIFLDVAPITIGDDVMFGPRVSLITATHPIDAGVRIRGLELGKAIHIGSRVWLGAGVIVNPGVSIGDNSIVGSGSVVTKSLPENVIAVGNPARVLRQITDEDKAFWEEKERQYHEDVGLD